MAYCSKCGTQNKEDAKFCMKCGVSLSDKKGRSMEESAEEWGEDFGKRAEKECFGLPHGGAIAGLIFGAIIIIVGISWLTGYDWTLFWPTVIIMFGLLMLVGGVYTLLRRQH